MWTYGIIQGDLSQPYEVSTLEAISGLVYSNRFPTPPIVHGFLMNPFQDEEDAQEEEFGVPFWVPVLKLQPPYYTNGALLPESNFLEPTFGQIWPR